MKPYWNYLILGAIFLHNSSVHSEEDKFFVNPGLILVENWEG